MIKPENFLDLADKLKQSFNDEVAYRTAISRYYYAAFLKIRTEFIAKLDAIKSRIIGLYNFIKDTERKNPHGFYILLMSTRNKYLAELLYSLRFLRNRSDYDIHENIEIKHVEASESYSKIIIEKTDKIIQEMFDEIKNNTMSFYRELTKILNKANEILIGFKVLLKNSKTLTE